MQICSRVRALKFTQTSQCSFAVFLFPGISCQINEVSLRMTQICENNPDFTGVNKTGWQILSRSPSASKGWCSAPTSTVERSCWGSRGWYRGLGVGFCCQMNSTACAFLFQDWLSSGMPCVPHAGGAAVLPSSPNEGFFFFNLIYYRLPWHNYIFEVSNYMYSC